jgi:hypothetical protein
MAKEKRELKSRTGWRLLGMAVFRLKEIAKIWLTGFFVDVPDAASHPKVQPGTPINKTRIHRIIYIISCFVKGHKNPKKEFLMSEPNVLTPNATDQSPSPQQPSGVPSPKTTEVLVILTAKQGITREQIMNVMPAEIRATVKLYLDGTIRQWYSKANGRGVVFFLDVKTVDEAHAIMDTLPLSKENLMDHEYIPVGPLFPLAGLIGGGPAKQ